MAEDKMLKDEAMIKGPLTESELLKSTLVGGQPIIFQQDKSIYWIIRFYVNR